MVKMLELLKWQGYERASLAVQKANYAVGVTYTHISHTNSGKKDNATPLFDWGKYYEKDGRILIPISIQAHHSFVDGIHIGQFVDALQKFFDEY